MRRQLPGGAEAKGCRVEGTLPEPAGELSVQRDDFANGGRDQTSQAFDCQVTEVQVLLWEPLRRF